MTKLDSTRFGRCTICKCTKPLSLTFFYRMLTKRNGFSSYCKVCFVILARQRRKEKPEVYEAWREKNADRLNAHKRVKYHEDPEPHRLARKARFQKNPESRRVGGARRRALLAKAAGSHTCADVIQMYEDQQGLCAYCETPLFGTYHVDHMTPLVKGGSNGTENLAVTCVDCNRSKHTKTAVEYMEYLRSR